MQYRKLSAEEIAVLERNFCRAQDWQNVSVAENFLPERLFDVEFIGTCRIGSNTDAVTAEMGVELSAGIRHARIVNSTIGDNSLVENVSGGILCSDIGDGCIISGVGTIRTTEGTSFGQGNTISVLNEAGDGNVVLYAGLTSQTAALMALPPGLGEYRDDSACSLERRRKAKAAVRRMVMEQLHSEMPERTCIGDGCRISDTLEITNAWIAAGTEVAGAQRISESTLKGSDENAVFVGTGVILDGCVLCEGASVSNNVVARNCFIGENSTLADQFSASDSLFFANSFMANGEACAAFCGPFTVSHHKSTLLIGGMYSFYNAGSNTNFSNHAYKMGPIHYGIMERGAKTASGAHILWPAHIGAFSMCMGKIATHPDTKRLPFSYVIGDGLQTYIVPARNIATVGTYRDVEKWPKRDMRPEASRCSAIDFEWLNVNTVRRIVEGKMLLEDILDKQPGREIYEAPDGSLIKKSSLHKGISLYTMAVKMFLADNMPIEGMAEQGGGEEKRGAGDRYVDLGGMLVSDAFVANLVDGILNGDIDNLDDVQRRISAEAADEVAHKAAAADMAMRIAEALYGWSSLDDDDRRDLMDNCREARSQWLEMIRKDAEREYQLGDVDRTTLDAFLEKVK